jgi:hypothetical protein
MPFINLDIRRKYNREWVAKRRAEYFKGKVCAACESMKDLQLDHIDPAEKISHSIWSWSSSRREIELRKCQVLCERCHMEKTMGEKCSASHGDSLYRKGCRCEICKEGHNRSKRVRLDKLRSYSHLA